MSTNQFNTGPPIAYFLTWTTYGTWLPGDKRGWNRKGEHESLEPNRIRYDSAQADMKESAFLLATDDKSAVDDTIRKHCQIRNWDLHAINVRSNHVHVVVTASQKIDDTKYEHEAQASGSATTSTAMVFMPPETVVAQFKAWCTRKLQPHHPDRKRFWTQGASCRWLNQESELSTTIEYVVEAQDSKGVEYGEG